MFSFLGFFGSAVSWLENSKKPFHFFLLVFFAAVFLRNLLEVLSTGAPMTIGSFVHYSFSYICIALAFILVFWLAVREQVNRIAKVVLPSFLVLLLAPLLDLVLTTGKGNAISYFVPGVHDNLTERFFTFFGSLAEAGATPGMRIEIALVLLASLAYFYLKNRSVLKSLFYSFVLYCVLFAYASILFFVKAFQEFFGFGFFVSDAILIQVFLVLVFLISLPLAFAWNRQYFLALLKDMRAVRIAHFVLMFFLGFFLALKSFPVGVETFFAIFPLLTSIFFACLFVLSSNNIADLKIDMVSNRTRPLAAGTIPDKTYSRMSLAFLALALAYAFFSCLYSFLTIIVFVTAYSLYSLPPARLKRIPLFSKAILAFNSLLFVVLGYSLLSPGLVFFPFWLFPIFLIGFSLSMNFIDFKDVEGDKKAGIMTLPVLFGEKKAKLFTGLFFLATHISFCLVLNKSFLPLLLVLGIVQLFLINRKNYDENPVFLLYLASILGLIILIFLGLA